MDRRKQFTKQPDEEFDIELSYRQYITGNVPNGANAISSVELSAVKWPRKQPTDKTDATEEILLNTEGVIDPVKPHKFRFWIQGGTDNYDYQVTAKITFDNGTKLEEEVYIRVRED